MRNLVVAVLALAGVGLADSSVMAQGGRRFGPADVYQNGWVFSLREGKRLARQTGKPLMVVLRCQP